MLTVNRLFTVFLLSTMCNLSRADFNQNNYMSALDEEANSLTTDQKTVNKVIIKSPPEVVNRENIAKHLSNGSFIDFIKNEYPASHRVYQQMPIDHKNEVFANYQLHFDINKSRQEMIKKLREK